MLYVIFETFCSSLVDVKTASEYTTPQDKTAHIIVRDQLVRMIVQDSHKKCSFRTNCGNLQSKLLLSVKHGALPLTWNYFMMWTMMSGIFTVVLKLSFFVLCTHFCVVKVDVIRNKAMILTPTDR